MLKSEISGDINVCSFDQNYKLNAIISESVKKDVGQYFETPDTRLVLDLGNISFIDSSGFGALLSIMKKARNNSGIFRLCNPVPEVESLFKLLQLHTIFDIYGSREECLKSFS
jgi:anti-sigma B factor antagonist